MGWRVSPICNTNCFKRQKWLHESASISRNKCIACHVCWSSVSFSVETSVLTLWARLSWSPWRFVACIVLQLLLTEYSADIQGAGAQHTTKFSFTQFMVKDKSAPRELPLRVGLLRSSKKPFYQAMLIVWWRERTRTFGPKNTENIARTSYQFHSTLG